MSTLLNRTVRFWKVHESCREVREGLCICNENGTLTVLVERGDQTERIEVYPDEEVWIPREN